MQITLKPSKYLAIFLLLIHLGAVICLFLLNFPIWLTIILICLIGYSMVFNLRRYMFLKSPRTITKLQHRQQNSWQLITKSEQILSAQLRKDSFVSRYLIILNFNVVKKRLSIPIVTDAIDQDKLRQLRVLLTTGNEYA